MDLLYFQWVDHFLRDVETVWRKAPVECFTIGEDKWKTAENWPVAAARPQTLYLDRGGRRGRRKNHGLLALSVPGADAADTYRYDPDDPAVNIIDMSENENRGAGGLTRRRAAPGRIVLPRAPSGRGCRHHQGLQRGAVHSSDAEDTDFIVRVTEATPDGKSIKLADGVLCAKYQEGFEAPRYLQPGAVYPIHIRTTKFSNASRRAAACG